MGPRPSCALFAVLLSSVWAGLGAPAAALKCPGKGGSQWRVATSAHFVVRTDQSERAARRLIEEYERIYEVFTGLLFRSDQPPPGRLDVVVFDSPADFYTILGVKQADAVSDGIFRRVEGQPTIYFADTTERENSLLLRHELTHHFIRHHIPNAPRWFNEGMAEYNSTLRIDGKKVRFGEVPPGGWIVTGGEALERGGGMFGGEMVDRRPPTIREVRTARAEEWFRGRRVSALYAGAFNLVHFLLHDDDDLRHRFAEYQFALTRGGTQEAAWDQAFAGIDPEALESRFAAYLSRSASGVFNVDFKPPAAPAIEGIWTMSDAEVHILWGRLRLSSSAMDKAAIEELDEALRLEPGAPEALFARSSRLLARRDYAGAQRDIEAALARRPAEERFLRRRAEVLLKRALPHEERLGGKGFDAAIIHEPDEADKAAGADLEPALAALAARAQTVESLNLLAWAHALRKQPERGLPLAQKAVSIEPGCWNCLDTLAQLAFLKGGAKAAASMQKRALELMPSDEYDGRMVARLKDYEAALAAKPVPAVPPAEAPPTPPADAPPAPEVLPDQLDRADVLHGMRAITPLFKKCYERYPVQAVIQVRFVVQPSGEVGTAQAGPPVDAQIDCVLRAVKTARFPRFRGAPMTIVWPVALR